VMDAVAEKWDAVLQHGCWDAVAEKWDAVAALYGIILIEMP